MGSRPHGPARSSLSSIRQQRIVASASCRVYKSRILHVVVFIHVLSLLKDLCIHGAITVMVRQLLRKPHIRGIHHLLTHVLKKYAGWLLGDVTQPY